MSPASRVVWAALLVALVLNHEALCVAARAVQGAHDLRQQRQQRRLGAGGGEERGDKALVEVAAKSKTRSLVRADATVREIVTAVILIVALTISVVNFVLKKIAQKRVEKAQKEIQDIIDTVVSQINEKAQEFSKLDGEARALMDAHEKALKAFAEKAAAVGLPKSSPLLALLQAEEGGALSEDERKQTAIAEAFVETLLDEMASRHVSEKGMNKEGFKADLKLVVSSFKKFDFTALSDRFADMQDHLQEKINEKLKKVGLNLEKVQVAQEVYNVGKSIKDIVATFGQHATVPNILSGIFGNSAAIAGVAANAMPVISLVSEVISLVVNVLNVIKTYKTCQQFVNGYRAEGDVFLLDADYTVCKSLGSVYDAYSNSLEKHTGAWESLPAATKAKLQQDWDAVQKPLGTAVENLKTYLKDKCTIFYRAHPWVESHPVREIWASNDCMGTVNSDNQACSLRGQSSPDIDVMTFVLENDKGFLYKAQKQTSYIYMYRPSMSDTEAMSGSLSSSASDATFRFAEVPKLAKGPAPTKSGSLSSSSPLSLSSSSLSSSSSSSLSSSSLSSSSSSSLSSSSSSESSGSSDDIEWEKGDKTWDYITHMVQKSFTPKSARDINLQVGDIDYASATYHGMFGNARFELVLDGRAQTRKRDAFAEVKETCEKFQNTKSLTAFQVKQCAVVNAGLKSTDGLNVRNLAPPPSTIWGKMDKKEQAPAVVLYYSRQSGAPIINMRHNTANRNVPQLRRARAIDPTLSALSASVSGGEISPRAWLEREGLVWLKVRSAMDSDTAACDTQYFQQIDYLKDFFIPQPWPFEV